MIQTERFGKKDILKRTDSDPVLAIEEAEQLLDVFAKLFILSFVNTRVACNFK